MVLSPLPGNGEHVAKEFIQFWSLIHVDEVVRYVDSTCLIYEKLLGWRAAAEGTPNKVFHVIHPFDSGVGLGVL